MHIDDGNRGVQSRVRIYNEHVFHFAACEDKEVGGAWTMVEAPEAQMPEASERSAETPASLEEDTDDDPSSP